MLNLCFCEDFVFGCQPFDDFNIKAVFHYKSALPWSCSIETLLIYRVYYRKIVFSAALIVVFTERRSGMNDTCTVFCCYIVHTCNEECFFVSLYKRHKLFVFYIFKVAAFHFFDDFIVALAENLICKALAYIKYAALFIACCHLNLEVIIVRSHCESYVCSQCPWSCRPCKEIFVCVFSLELCCDSCCLDFLVSLRHLM